MQSRAVPPPLKDYWGVFLTYPYNNHIRQGFPRDIFLFDRTQGWASLDGWRDTRPRPFSTPWDSWDIWEANNLTRRW